MNGSNSAGNLPASGSSRSIGDILVATGRLSAANLKKILESQEKEHIPFGEAAVALQLLNKDDIDFALSKQFDYAYLNATDTSLSPQLVAAYKPFSKIGENLRAVRSQLMLRWFDGTPNHKVLTVVSPSAGEGRSFIAANLAVVFAQHGERTLLIDADLRAKPELGQQTLFKLGRGAGLSSLLAGRAGLEAAQVVPGLPGLAVLTAGVTPPNPQELLGREGFGNLLVSASDFFDVILIDTPAGDEYADVDIIASRARAAILVTRQNATVQSKAIGLCQRLQDSGVAMVGSILNVV
jgi:receptor protein-tyrosine kinase